jgi:hypothetical protein
MKEIQKKDLPEISGGQDIGTAIIGPGCIPLPYPQTPGSPIDPPDPLGDGPARKQVNS